MSGLAPFAHHLPYWAFLPAGTGDALVMVDGTIVVGFDVAGVDTYAAENTLLNANARGLRRALNVLPDRGFLQVVLASEPGVAVAEACDALPTGEAQGQAAMLLNTLRRSRQELVQQDRELRTRRLRFYVGSVGALSLSSSRALFGRRRPCVVDRGEALKKAGEVAEVAARVAAELSAIGVHAEPLPARSMLADAHRLLNPGACHAGEVLEESVLHETLSLREQLPLSDLVVFDESFSLGDPQVLGRVLSISRLPAATRPDLTMALSNIESTCVVSTTFVATDKTNETEKLTRKRNIAHAQAAGMVRDIAADVAFVEHEEALQKIVSEDQRVFRVSCQVLVLAQRVSALERAAAELKEAFSESGTIITTESCRQLPAFLAMLPGNGHRAPQMQTLLTDAAADFVSSFSPNPGDPDPQVLFHTRHRSLRGLSMRPSPTRPNENALVFGGSGSGKSFVVASLLEQAFLSEGASVTVADVQGPQVSSYRQIANAFGGTYDALLSSGGCSVSLFPSKSKFMGGGEPEAHALVALCRIVLLMAAPSCTDARERMVLMAVLQEAICLSYDGVTRADEAPCLRDVAAVLSTMKTEHEEHRALARAMFLALDAFLKDKLRARLLCGEERRVEAQDARNGHTPIRVYDFHGMEQDKELAAVLLASLSFSLWDTLKSTPREQQKLVVLDECWKLLQDEGASQIVAELFRTGRKWGASTFAITQSLQDFKSSPIHHAVLGNASRMLLLQHASDHREVASFCGLTAREEALFKTLQVKKGEHAEMLLVERAHRAGGSAASVLRYQPSAFELWLNTTDPRDTGLRDRVMRERGCSFAEAVALLARKFPWGAVRAAE